MSEAADRVRAFLDLWDTRPHYTENIYGLGEEEVLWLTTSDLRSLLAELNRSYLSGFSAGITAGLEAAHNDEDEA